MKQIFNEKQLIIIWVVGVIVSVVLIVSTTKYDIWPAYGRRDSLEDFFRSLDWIKVVAAPLVILGALLIITFGGEERTVQNLEKETRKRDRAFLRCWEKGMSDKELARKFNLEIQGVKALKEKLRKTKGGTR